MPYSDTRQVDSSRILNRVYSGYSHYRGSRTKKLGETVTRVKSHGGVLKYTRSTVRKYSVYSVPVIVTMAVLAQSETISGA